jgi:DNA repair protein RadA/Sms
VTTTRTQYRCRECGAVTPRWAGRCSPCGAWNALEEEVRTSRAGRPTPGPGERPAVALSTVAGEQEAPWSTGLAELDRVLGGGLVPGSVTLIAGEPGIGKSTLLLQMLAGMAAQGRRALLVAAEESPAQVGRRAARLGLPCSEVLVTADIDLGAVRTQAAAVQPDVLVVDSIQAIRSADGGAPGSVGSVRGAATELAEDAKGGGPAVVLVGHVTKDGSIAGPRALEHLVDTVLSFEGDRHHAVRMLRAVKHRFGPVGELGFMEMTAKGLRAVPDGAGLLLADRRPCTPGSAVFAGMEGRRSLLVEIQALVAPAFRAAPRRSASGYDSGRLAQLLAVLDRRAGVELRHYDTYVSVVGGVHLSDPGADLAVAAALASAAAGRPVPDDLVLVGEVGLGGEVRQVAHTPRRLAEASRFGFTRALVPPGAGRADGIRTIDCPSLTAAFDFVLATQPAPRPKLRVLHGAGPDEHADEGAAGMEWSADRALPSGPPSG